MGRNRFATIGFRHCLLKLALKLRRHCERFVRISGEYGHDGAFGKRIAINHNLSAYDGTGSELHDLNATPGRPACLCMTLNVKVERPAATDIRKKKLRAGGSARTRGWASTPPHAPRSEFGHKQSLAGLSFDDLIRAQQ